MPPLLQQDYRPLQQITCPCIELYWRSSASLVSSAQCYIEYCWSMTRCTVGMEQSIPEDITSAETLYTFCHRLKTNLFQRYSWHLFASLKSMLPALIQWSSQWLLPLRPLKIVYLHLQWDAPSRRPWWIPTRCQTGVGCCDARCWWRWARRPAAAPISAAGEAASAPSGRRRRRCRTTARRRRRTQADQWSVPSSCGTAPTHCRPDPELAASAVCSPSTDAITRRDGNARLLNATPRRTKSCHFYHLSYSVFYFYFFLIFSFLGRTLD